MYYEPYVCVPVNVRMSETEAGALKKGSRSILHTLGQSLLTLGLEFHMYARMHAFATLTASYHMVKVHDLTAKHRALY